MTEETRDIVVVGGGLAGAKAAEAAREAGFDGRLTLVGEEVHRPYDRPPLSKGLLLGKTSVEDVFVHPPDFYRAHDIELHTGDPATRIDRDAGAVHTQSGRRLRFDRLLLATGGAPRTLPLTDAPLDGVVTLRTLDDASALAAQLGAVEHVTVVGAGWIGCEVAAAARTRGANVTIVDPLEVPLARVLGPEMGRVFADLHADHGVDLLLGRGAARVDGRHAVEEISLTDGRTVPTQLVVVGVGVLPRVDLAQEAGLDVDGGILVDATLTASDPRILAAGDVARAWHPRLRRHLRVEHWANALNQGLTAGRNLLGAGEEYDRVPYFYSDQYDLGMEYCGHAGPEDEVVVRGSTGEREFVAFWLRHGRVVAGMNVNVWDVTDDVKRLIRSGEPVDPQRLADAAVPLGSLVTGP